MKDILTETREAPTNHAINSLLSHRWSPYSFSDRAIPVDDLRAIFEAARWAPSCYNEQPWFYIVATQDDPKEFKKLLSCLVEGNQVWADRVPVLALGCASTTFALNGTSNRLGQHDLGQASANLTLEASARGLSVHQMAGIDPSRAKKLYDVPDLFEVVTGIAIGYVGDNPHLPDEVKNRDALPRTRKNMNEIVFAGSWGNAHPLISR